MPESAAETESSIPPKIPLTWMAIAAGGAECSVKHLREAARLIDGLKVSGSKQQLIDRLKVWAAEDVDRFHRYFGEVSVEDGSAAVAEELREVDMKPLERLLVVRRERDVYAGRLERLDEKSGDYSAAVVDRVRRGYESRLEEIEEQARTPREAARREYAKLRSHLEGFEEAHHEAVIEKEELTLRHGVGEIGTAQFETRLRGTEGRLRERQARVADAQGMRRRFIDAVGSEKELEGPVDVALEADDEPGEDERETVAAADHPVAASTVTILAKVPAGMVHEQEGDAGATMILPRAWLVSRQENGSTSDYRLGPMETVIGRSPKSDIRVVNETVSRQHAKLTAGPQGYVISDLGSENGTLINRERVDKRLLVDKDIIRIGPAEFEFRQS